MAQPTQEAAASEINETVETVAAEPTIEDRFAAFGDEQEDEDQPEEGAEAPAEAEEAEEEEVELTEEDETEEGEAEDPPIAAPVSWTAEEKEEFKNLPRTLQETLTRREAERERFVQSKAQEAKQARSQVEKEALSHIQQLQSQMAQQLSQYASQMEVQRPDPRLIVEDPETYAYQLSQYEHYTAQRQNAQRQAQMAQAEAQRAQQEIAAREAQETHAVLTDKFPEYLDPVNGPKLREELGSIAIEAGYPAELLAQANATDILAMRYVANLKNELAETKARLSRYDKAKMETVREAKKLPNVSKPGVAKGKGAVQQERYAADRQAMRSGDVDAAKRVFGQFV